MNIRDLWTIITKKYPLSNAAEWDFVGHQIGHWKQRVNRVMFVLDVTSDVVAFAIKNKCDLIISYHPFFFGNKKQILEKNKLKAKLFKDLKKAHIALYSLHTAIDNSNNSLASYMLHLLGFTKVKDTELSFAKTGESNLAISKKQVIKKCCDLFLINQIGIINQLPLKIKKVVLANGSHDFEVIDIASKLKVDVLICGEMDYHTKLYAKEMKVPVLIVGHFMEWLFQNQMKKEFSSIINLKILEYKEKNFIQFKGYENGK